MLRRELKNKIEYSELVVDKNSKPYIFVVSNTSACPGDYTMRLFQIFKHKNKFVKKDTIIGECRIEKDVDKYYVSYDIALKFRGLGLGKQMIKVSKNFLKSINVRYIYLLKETRLLPYVNNPDQQVDANLMLYLESGFEPILKPSDRAVDGSLKYQTMVCDLLKEKLQTTNEKILDRLNNSVKAFDRIDELEKQGKTL